MRQHPAFADTVFETLLGAYEVAPAAAPAASARQPMRERLATRRPGEPRPMPAHVAAARVPASQVERPALSSAMPSTAPTSPGQMLPIGLMALVLMPAASLSMLMVLQTGAF